MTNRNLDLLKVAFDKGNNEGVVELIQSFRSGPPVPGLISLFSDIYKNTNIALIRDSIRQFMNDMKSQEMVSEIIESATLTDNQETKRMLIGSAWASGLDYSAFSNELINFFIEGSLELSIECYSVISESVTIPVESERAAFADRIDSFMESFDLSKRALAGDLIKLLRSNDLPGVTHAN